jgi:hypothetical protein
MDMARSTDAVQESATSCCKPLATETVEDSADAGKQDTMIDEYDLDNIDINEWAGACLLSPLRHWLIFKRVIQDLRGQELRSIRSSVNLPVESLPVVSYYSLVK